MKTEWDYTKLADAYLKRPDYSDDAIDAMIKAAGIKDGDMVCDIGAGVAHLTLMLAQKNFNVIAVEPNDAMRNNGIKRTEAFKNVSWFEGTGENTGQSSESFDLVTFGSSFNVCDRLEALKESFRLLKPDGWFACMWNNRNLDDPIQSNIENIIKNNIKNYNYGTRREVQTPVINSSGLFKSVIHISSDIKHKQNIDECVKAWNSHATLERQAGESFGKIISEIEKYLIELNTSAIDISYTTNIWLSQRK